MKYLSTAVLDNGREVVVATLPLTDNETWLPLPIEQVAMFFNGERCQS